MSFLRTPKGTNIEALGIYNDFEEYISYGVKHKFTSVRYKIKVAAKENYFYQWKYPASEILQSTLNGI